MLYNLYINSGVKNVYFFGVRNIEGQNHSGHPVFSIFQRLSQISIDFKKKKKQQLYNLKKLRNKN